MREAPSAETSAAAPEPIAPPPAATAVNIRESKEKIAEIYPATGKSVSAAPSRSGPRPARGDIALNFTGAELREVVQVILRDLLGVSYVIDQDVRGVVTVNTEGGLAREDLIPALETILEANGATLVRAGQVYRVTRSAAAADAAADIGVAGAGAPPGFGVTVYPLNYLGAEEMRKILEPVLPEGRLLRADPARNLIVVAGGERDQRLARDTIRLFDIDPLADSTVLIESLQNVDAATMAFELDNVLGGLKDGPLSGVVRLIPIERMNALMVISKQPRYIEEARQWIARLDRTRNAQGRRLFVYYAQNSKAADLAQTLIGIFQPGQIVPARAPLAPPRPGAPAQPEPEAAESPAAAPTAAPDAPRIMADDANNAVLVMATPAEYETIEEVLAKLDLQPLQVLIEATIIEVTLRDQLRFGVQYFIKSGGLGITDTGTTVLSAGNSALIQPTFPGFAFTLADTAQARMIIDTLSELTELNVISAPQVLALNNQTARLQVGDQVPIVVQTSASTLTADTRIVNAIEYRDTGVTLGVTPRVNAGGLVTLEISQEVSDVVPTTTSNIDSPTIQQRKIVSTVAVQSGQTVALGGLIRESSMGGRSGIPGLVDLPVVGLLFGQSNSDVQRTELLVMITPTVMRNERQASDITAQIRRKYQALMELEDSGVRRPRRLQQKWPWQSD